MNTIFFYIGSSVVLIMQELNEEIFKHPRLTYWYVIDYRVRYTDSIPTGIDQTK